MTTEDDTFNALRREPFNSVIRELACRAAFERRPLEIPDDDLFPTKSIWSSGNENLDPHWIKFLEDRGWTIKDFEDRCKRDVQEYESKSNIKTRTL